MTDLTGNFGQFGSNFRCYAAVYPHRRSLKKKYEDSLSRVQAYVLIEKTSWFLAKDQCSFKLHFNYICTFSASSFWVIQKPHFWVMTIPISIHRGFSIRVSLPEGKPLVYQFIIYIIPWLPQPAIVHPCIDFLVYLFLPSFVSFVHSFIHLYIQTYRYIFVYSFSGCFIHIFVD